MKKKKSKKVLKKLQIASELLECMENSTSAILNTPESSCEHHVMELMRKEIIDSIKIIANIK